MLNFDFNQVANDLANYKQLLAMVDDILAKHRIMVRYDPNGLYYVYDNETHAREDHCHFIFAYKYALDLLDKKINATVP